jgi:4-hydroxybenzoate polyprenyltransferase/phosphoglycolate phosphatase-like HAD superfamily hydrolase
MRAETKNLDYEALAVDVDGTLLRTDLLHESVFALLKLNPFYVFLLPVWLLQGKAHLKQMIANRVDLPASLLPYREDFVAYLKEEHAAGKKLVLATASNIRYAQGIAEYLGLFSVVIGSTASENLSGPRKLAHIRKELGHDRFAYAGNSSVDLPIWQNAVAAIVVDAPTSLERRAAKVSNVIRVFATKRNLLKSLARAMRPHQWLKNLLIFVPLVLAHQLSNPQAFHQAALAFIAFCLCASSVYLLNDMLDLASDRQHPTKRFRPFAAGDLPITYGVAAMFVLLAGSVLIALELPPFFVASLALYYVATLAYSLWLKSALLVDALMLASLYTMRLIAGAAAISVEISFWLLAFSMFLFLSLAFIKRYSELLVLDAEGRHRLVGRAYQTVDMETVSQLGAASGYLSVMVMALYIHSDKVNLEYARPEALWIFCPMMLYWISRMWLFTRRGEMHDDPVVFTMKDKRTYALGAIAAVAYFVSKYWPVLRQFVPEYFL